MTKPAAFYQDDVCRAAKGVTAAGLRVLRVDVAPDGTISVIVDEAESSAAPAPKPNPLDRLHEPEA